MAPCYPHEVQGFAAEVGGLLEEQATALDSSTRLALVGCHIVMQASASAGASLMSSRCGIVASVSRSPQKPDISIAISQSRLPRCRCGR